MEQKTKNPGVARRAVVGVAKSWSYSIGLTSALREGFRIIGNIADGFRFVRRKLADGPHNYRHETFQDAVDRLGLDETHLIRQARVFNFRALSWLAALLLATVWLAGAAWSDAPLLHVIMCLGAMTMTFAKAITWRFRFAQIRDAELYSFGPWFWSLGGKW